MAEAAPRILLIDDDVELTVLMAEFFVLPRLREQSQVAVLMLRKAIRAV